MVRGGTERTFHQAAVTPRMDPTAARVTAVDDVGPDTIALDVETPEGFDAQPGQFVKLSLEVDGEEESRFYTLSSLTVDDTFEITIGIDPEGTVGPRLAELAAGDTVTVSGPFGTAHYEGEDRVVVFAGGPGLGPAIGIAERALSEGGEAAIVYEGDFRVHESRLATLAAAGADVFVVGEGDDEALADAANGALEGDEQVFVYGFADFLDEATAVIEAAGGTPDEAKMENFG